MVRPDYHRQPILSYAEAALIAGVKMVTVERWVYTNQLNACRRHGPYRIDQQELLRMLREPTPPKRRAK
ncbi:MAG: helix-turn-helix domain-containing protein [Planctomycetota bacterium]|nr:helix-turn-helix domain-containing protein [Planctomycetota bacterium]